MSLSALRVLTAVSLRPQGAVPCGGGGLAGRVRLLPGPAAGRPSGPDHSAGGRSGGPGGPQTLRSVPSVCRLQVSVPAAVGPVRVVRSYESYEHRLGDVRGLGETIALCQLKSKCSMPNISASLLHSP